MALVMAVALPPIRGARPYGYIWIDLEDATRRDEEAASRRAPRCIDGQPRPVPQVGRDGYADLCRS